MEEEKVDYNKIYTNQEIKRAEEVLAKAKRDGLDVVEVLSNHMVSKTLIEKLTGTVPQVKKKKRKKKDLKMLLDVKNKKFLEKTLEEAKKMSKELTEWELEDKNLDNVDGTQV